MQAYLDPKEGEGEPRPHPWTVSITDPRGKFVDFRQEPHRIRTDLEDFLPYGAQAGIEKYYRFLEWLNGPESIWESTESFFRAPASHSAAYFKKFPLMCSGRVVFFCRDHGYHCRRSAWIRDRLLNMLLAKEPVPANACVAVFDFPVQFTALSDDGGQTAPICAATGAKFFGFGQTEREAFDGFGSGVEAVWEVSKEIADMLAADGLKP